MRTVGAAIAISTALLLVAQLATASLHVGLERDQQLAKDRNDWTEIGKASDDSTHKLVFALKQRNLAELQGKLLSVSSPSSTQYGEFLSVEEIDELIRPSQATLQTVHNWLSSAGVADDNVCSLTRGKEFLECDVTVKQASDLLSVEFYKYKQDDVTVIRAAGHYSVPVHVEQHIDFVGGVHRLPRHSSKITNTTQYRVARAHGLGAVEPKTIRELYGIGSTVGAGAEDTNIQAVAQFLNQHYHAADLTHFMEKYAADFTHMSKVAKEIGPDSGHAGIEASLDIEYIMSVGANIPTWFWSTAGEHEGQEPFLLWIEAVANTSTIPNVISVSYGDDEDTLSASYMKRISVEFQKLGLRGVSILFASGDDGAGCHKQIFRPNFPASSPYITAVGGTLQESEGKEYGVSFSSGGFSNVFGTASYQSSDVHEYLAKAEKLPEERFFNKSGRGYPDVSALATDFIVINNLFPVPASGTSCASPTFASVVSLVNDQLINKHQKSPLGFLNPFLYSTGFNGLTDIMNGCNEGCNGKGFCAAPGWDPVTGLGTPQFEKLLEEALKAKSI